MKRLNNKFVEDRIYNLSDMNWKDDTLDTGIGDVDGSDPSMKGYNKGWQMEPYKERFYAKKKEGAKEVIDISYTSENLANEILQLWSQVDGPIQNFFEGFTMNKVSNQMKKEIANILRTKGYDVYPVLVDETPRFAKVIKKMKKLSINKLVSNIANVFSDSEVLSSLLIDINKLQKENYKITTAEINGLLDYYKQIFPEDFAAKLVNICLDNNKDTSMEMYKDIQLSDESLNALEDRLNGQADPLNQNNQNAGPNMDFGMDSTTQMRSDIGVPPNSYETRLSKKKN